MAQTALKYEVPYINLMPGRDEYRYTDGNHLYKASSFAVSEDIGMQIQHFFSGL